MKRESFDLLKNHRLAVVTLVALAALVGFAIPRVLPGADAPGQGAAARHEEATAGAPGATAGAPAAAGEEAEAEAEAEGTPELPNLVTVLYHYLPHAGWVRFLHKYENVFFAWVAVLLLGLLAGAAYRRRALHPGRFQALVEIGVEGLDNLVCGLLGTEGRRYTPFLGTLFLYILLMNLMGLVPLLKSPTSAINTTGALAICVFCYVQYTGFRNLGFLGYFHHLMGSPRDLTSWLLVPLMLPLHIISELARPLTLALRLFGNITGEDVLLAAFVGLGAATLHFTREPVGLPFQIPLYFLAMLTSVIQALVFTLLSTVYFLLMQRHEEEGAH